MKKRTLIIAALICIIFLLAIINAAGWLSIDKVYYNTNAWSGSYPDTNHVEATDGIFGILPITNANWFANDGVHEQNITIDLNASYYIDNITTVVLTNTVSSVWLPAVFIWTSDDNSTWAKSGMATMNGGNATSDTVRNATLSIGLTKRYVKFEYVNQNTRWTFISEGLVYGSVEVDTCTCAGAGNNWEINMADHCNITSACDLTTGKLSFTGAGWVNCNAAINTTNLGDPGNGAILYVNSSCAITIN